MIDLGLSFADEKFPGIDLLVPQIDFLEQIKDNLEAVIISLGHEDHAGALAIFANKINDRLTPDIQPIIYCNRHSLFRVNLMLSLFPMKPNGRVIQLVVNPYIYLFSRIAYLTT